MEPALSGPPVVPAPSFGGLGGLLGALVGPAKKADAPEVGEDREPEELSEQSFLPMTSQLSSDYLESYFAESHAGAVLPDRRGDWQIVEFFSPALGRQASYMAWLPPGYDTSTGTYPTLYLLHGVGGEDGFGVEEWLGYALTETIERMLSLGLIEPMIVVLPNGEQGYWMNHSDGGPRWGDFVAIELVQHVDATFRTAAGRERRAIGGLSMGGHGALQLALNFPDTFSIAGAHSPTLRPFETSPEFFGDQNWFAQYDPLSLVRSSDAAPRIATWIDVGHEDTWRRSAELLRGAFQAKHAPLEFRTLEGEHEGWYWKHYLPEYLGFYSAALHATQWTPQGAPLVPGHSLVVANTDFPTP
jgi:enterochelin esterase-like enzyme